LQAGLSPKKPLIFRTQPTMGKNILTKKHGHTDEPDSSNRLFKNVQMQGVRCLGHLLAGNHAKCGVLSVRRSEEC
jgi:hypothetical protein